MKIILSEWSACLRICIFCTRIYVIKDCFVIAYSGDEKKGAWESYG